MIATCYAGLIALVAAATWWWTGSQIAPLKLASWALSGGTALQLALLLVTGWAWRPVWRWIPALNRWIFPDLNGTWTMTIEWKGPVAAGSGTSKAVATIRLDLLKISIDVIADNSISHTLAVTAQKDPESSRPRLVYVFLVEPQAVSGPSGIPYRAAAVLHHYREAEGEILRGKYWTERQTVGNYVLRRTA
jgi:hypothetical protein